MTYRPLSRVFVPADATGLAVSLEDMRQHLRIDSADEDVLIVALMRAAQRTVEKKTQRLLTRRSVKLHLPSLPAGLEPIELPGGSVGAVTAITVDGVAASTAGLTIIGDSPALLVPSVAWPVPTGENFPVSIDYTAGYVTAPDDLVAAVKLICADLFERRMNSSDTAVVEVPVSAAYLMEPHMIRAI